MRLQARLKQLDASTPKCDGRIRRIVVGQYLPTAADRCRLCGGCHVLVIKRKIVTSRADVKGGGRPCDSTRG